MIFITTPDDSIYEFWQKLLTFNLTNKIICHTSSSLTSSIFLNINNSDAFEYSVHPIFAFSDKYNSYKDLQTAYFSIEGPESHIHELKDFIYSYGAAARCVQPGDKIIIMTFFQINEEKTRKFKPAVVLVNETNTVVEISHCEIHGKIKFFF